LGVPNPAGKVREHGRNGPEGSLRDWTNRVGKGRHVYFLEKGKERNFSLMRSL
jgi:hypothetical protein